MVRNLLVWVHRWAGLGMTLFLVIVGLTGSVLAFREDLDAWLNPDLLIVAKRAAPVLDGFALREKAAALYPNERFDDVPLHILPDRSVQFSHMPGMKPEDNMMQKMVEFYLDPYTGEKLGERPVWSAPSIDRKNIISFIYRLHFALASPFAGWYVGNHSLGAFILGVIALIWTIDCFIAFYLTFPLKWRLTGDDTPAARSFWGRWKPAWLIKTSGGFIRLNFDVHRAFGLWTWALLFVFAWSSVALNLGEVYTPTMNLLFGAPVQAAQAAPPANLAIGPTLDFRQAYALGTVLMHSEAKRRGRTILQEDYLSFDRDGMVYTLTGRSSGELTRHGATSVSIDARTGRLRTASFPGDGSRSSGDAITSWLIWLHVAEVFGMPYRIIVCVLGVVIALLSASGVYIWWKKRRARQWSRAREVIS